MSIVLGQSSSCFLLSSRNFCWSFLYFFLEKLLFFLYFSESFLIGRIFLNKNDYQTNNCCDNNHYDIHVPVEKRTYAWVEGCMYWIFDKGKFIPVKRYG